MAMSDKKQQKSYYPIAIYLFLFAVIAILPAGVTTYLAIKNADEIQLQAEQETIRRSQAELLKEISHLSEEIEAITLRLAAWDETLVLFNDATYYNYWRDTRIKDNAQYKSLIDAVDLYSDKGNALTADYVLTKTINPDATAEPAVVTMNTRNYLVYYQPVYIEAVQNQKLIGYIGIRMDLDRAMTHLMESEHSYITSIQWQIPNNAALSIKAAIDSAKVVVASQQEIDAFANTIRNGFTEYFIYAVSLVILLVVLLTFSVARPLSRLAGYLKAIYSGAASSIPVHFHGAIRIRELEVVRQAINDFKMQFQSAAATLEEKNEELLRLTYHDPLTGCYNRRAFEARLTHALDMAVVEGKQHALCYIDIDQFKIVNDTCGHVAGDELLKQIAVLLEHDIRDADMLARLGGDEFGVLLEGCSLEQAQNIAESMRQKVKTQGFAWQDKLFDISISIGLVPINLDSLNISEIWKNADAACYVAKDSGRNRVQVYQAHDKELAQRSGEMQWVSRLKKAIDEDRFELYAQMIKPIDMTNSQEHYEVLLRMCDSNNDLIPPMAFIPAAERYNMMPDIDRWVIRNALELVRRSQHMRPDNVMLSINLSGQSIGNKETLDFIKAELDSNEIDPSQICFEITETAAIKNLTAAINFIKSLRIIGCKFSLDDFGSGLSSFGYLSNLEVDFIKIDGKFIKSMQSNTLSHSIISAINQIGHVMGVKTIAEFVENKDILNHVVDIGIDFVQGYGVHRPVPLTELLQQDTAVNY